MRVQRANCQRTSYVHFNQGDLDGIPACSSGLEFTKSKTVWKAPVLESMWFTHKHKVELQSKSVTEKSRTLNCQSCSQDVIPKTAWQVLLQKVPHVIDLGISCIWPGIEQVSSIKTLALPKLSKQGMWEI